MVTTVAIAVDTKPQQIVNVAPNNSIRQKIERQNKSGTHSETGKLDLIVELHVLLRKRNCKTMSTKRHVVLKIHIIRKAKREV